MVVDHSTDLREQAAQIFEDHEQRFSGAFFAQIIAVMLNASPGSFVQIRNWSICRSENDESVLVDGGNEEITNPTLNYINKRSRMAHILEGFKEGKYIIFKPKRRRH